jgi:TolB-like protein/DNA-binding winged helix-turn-helix (wHTH) protein/tetratricopeptide (TPR) repeat protein
MSAQGHTPESARGAGASGAASASATTTPLTLRFSTYELDFARHELRHSGALVALQPTPLRVLLYLAEHRDRTVPRRELLDAIWPGVVVGDEALTTALAEARHAVGDDGASQRVVRTLKGAGYRFVAELVESGVATAVGAESQRGLQGRSRRRVTLTLAGIAAAILALAGGLRSLLDSRGELPRAIESPSIAVLPFVDLSGTESDQVIADDLTEQVIHDLTSRGLTVVARTSSFAWKDRATDVREIARTLGATHVLEGSVRRIGERVRIAGQLNLGETGVQIWSGFEEIDRGDLLTLHDRITKRIAGQVSLQFLRLTPETKRLLEGTDSRIWPLLLEMNVQGSEERFDEALETSRRILEIDRGHAFTHAMRIHYWGTAADQGKISREEAGPGIRASAAAVLGVAPNNAMSMLALARAAIFDWNWTDAERLTRRACERDTEECAGFAFSCTWMGCRDEHLRISQFAVQARPEDEFTWGYFRTLALMNAGRFEEAKRASLRAIDLNWERSAPFLGMIYWKLGERDKAVDFMRLWYPEHDPTVEVAEAIDRERAIGGPDAVVRWLAEEFSRDDSRPSRIMGARNHHFSAMHWLAIGENERALDQIEIAWDRREGEMRRYIAGALFDPIRDTPRFRALIEKMGLTAYHAKYLKRPHMTEPVAPAAASVSAPAAP